MPTCLRVIVLIVFCALMSACADTGSITHPKVTELPHSGMNVKQTKMMPLFDSICLDGPFDVSVNLAQDPAYANVARVEMQGDSGVLDTIQWYVKNNTLTMSVSRDYIYDSNYPIKVNIYTNNIKRLYMLKDSKIKISPLQTTYMRVIGKDKAHVELAGYVQRLDATFIDDSRLNAKCLYTRSIFVNTTDTAQAEVLNNGGGISALAADKSDIYYYKAPDMVAPYERQNGSIMRMQGIVPPFAQQPAEVPQDKIVEGRG